MHNYPFATQGIYDIQPASIADKIEDADSLLQETIKELQTNKYGKEEES